MEGPSAVPVSNRTALVAIVVAVVALGAFVVVGIGVLLGWIPRGGATDGATATAGPGTPAGKASRGLEKFAGSEPLMPKYSQPHAPPPAPLQDFAVARPAPPPPTPAAAPAPEPPPASLPRGPFVSGDPFGPAPPSFGRAEPRAAPERAAPEASAQHRRVCEDCGRIIGIANWRSGWEVRVRFDDGATQTFNFRRRPPFDLGERVRLDAGELVHD